MCTPKKNGRLEVSAEIKKKFDEGGSSRSQLIQVMIDANRDKDTTVCKFLYFTCTVLLGSLCPVGPFPEEDGSDRETFQNPGNRSLGWLLHDRGHEDKAEAAEATYSINSYSSFVPITCCVLDICVGGNLRSTIKAVVKYCSNPARKAELIRTILLQPVFKSAVREICCCCCRNNKYERKKKEYWYEEQTTGKVNTSLEEGWEEKYEVGEGEVARIDLRGSSGPILPDDELESDSDSSDDSSSAGSAQKKKKKKDKKNKKKKKDKKCREDPLEEEHQLEAPKSQTHEHNFPNSCPAPVPSGGHRQRRDGHV